MIGRILIAACAALSACSSAPLRLNTQNVGTPLEIREDPSQYVVVTVHNHPNSQTPGAASTPRGYNAASGYALGSRTLAVSRAIAADYKLKEVAAWPIAVLGVHCLVYRMAPQTNRMTLLTSLAQDARVESAQAMESFRTQSSDPHGALAPNGQSDGVYNDTYAGLQRNLQQLSVPQTHPWSRGEGVRIAVIDTGVDTAHPDLQGRIVSQRNFVDDDAARFRSDVHGTAVAGVIAALADNRLGIVGIAPAVKLQVLKACWHSANGPAGDSAVCNSFTLAQALAAAIEARADVVNLSLAGPSDPLLTRLVRAGQRVGIIFVGAAPPATARAGFPVEIEGVLGVEASESRNAAATGLLAAPGKDIFTLRPAGHYDAASGSSLAAAEVSAVVALLRARDSALTAAQAKQLLDRSSQTFTPANASNTTRSVNACEAMAILQHRGSCSALTRRSDKVIHSAVSGAPPVTQ